jgi:hypothetical protein
VAVEAEATNGFKRLKNALGNNAEDEDAWRQVVVAYGRFYPEYSNIVVS